MHADAFGIFAGDFQSGVFEGIDARGHAQLDEAVHFARFFFRHVAHGIEVFDFAGHGAGKAGGIELGNGVDTALAGNDIGPVLVDAVAERGDNAHAGNDDSSLSQNIRPLVASTRLA